MTQTLLTQGESQGLEYKASFDRAAIETLVAFANAQGGSGKRCLAPFYDYPEVRFSINESQGGVWAVFELPALSEEKQIPHEGVSGGVSGGVNVGVNVGVNSILNFVQDNPGLRAGEIASNFSVTKRTVERWLKQLKDQGVIEFRGAPKTGGYFFTEGKK